MNRNVIALDGPAGSGKSSVAREIAAKIGFHYFDSGAYYRAITYHAMEIYRSVATAAPFSVWIEGREDELVQGVKLDCIFSDSSENIILLNEKNISHEIRTPEVTNEIRYIANKKKFRDFVNAAIRELVVHNRLVMDGRDIGSEVFPDAVYKFYLTASIQVRALRRHNDLKSRGIDFDLEELQKDIESRDKTDMERAIAPLKKAHDAILIDTSHMPKNIVIENILSKIHKENL